MIGRKADEEKDKWGNIRARQSLIKRVEIALEAARPGEFPHLSQFVDFLLRRELEKMGKGIQGISTVRIHKDHVRIMDRNIGKLGKILSVSFKKERGDWEFLCDYCKETDCIHVDFTLELSEIIKMMEDGTDQPDPKDNLTIQQNNSM